MIHLILQVDRFEIFFRIELIGLNEIVAKLDLRSLDIVDKNYENQGLKISKLMKVKSILIFYQKL